MYVAQCGMVLQEPAGRGWGGWNKTPEGCAKVDSIPIVQDPDYSANSITTGRDLNHFAVLQIVSLR